MTENASRFRMFIPFAALVVAAAVAFLLVDGPVGSHFGEHPASGEVKNFFDAAEHFGTPFGQILILVILSGWVKKPERRWNPVVMRVFVTAVIAGLAADVGKLMISRYRPHHFDFDLHMADSFAGLLRFGAGGHGQQSFPSAHTASAFGFAAALAWAWPKQQRVFYSLAALVGLQRVVMGAHFPSDVLAGAALGYLVASLYINNAWVTRIWDRIDAWCLGEPPPTSPSEQTVSDSLPRESATG